MNRTVDIFISLLRCAITGTSEEIDLSDADFESLYSLAKLHDLAHIVYYELNKRGVIKEGDLYSKFQNQFNVALYRFVQRETTIEQLRGIFEKSHIPFIVLKGSFLQQLYPEAWMRTSSDIDFLVNKHDFQHAIGVLTDYGMRKGNKDTHDITLITENGYHVELHHSLIEDYVFEKASTILADVWNYSFLKDSYSVEYEMNDDIMYLYHISHMVKHFRNGGCGVRSIIDTWLLNHKLQSDKTKRIQLLVQTGLQTFAECAYALSENWFSKTNYRSSEEINGFEEFVISGGVHGTLERAVLIRKKDSDYSAKYFFNRLFLPYNQVKQTYPILIKCPFLLPVFWIARWMKLLSPNVRKKTATEIKLVNNVDHDAKEQTEDLLKKLEIWR